MTPEEHQERHRLLHRSLDELLACYIQECRGNGSGSVYNQIIQFLQWSHEKKLAPSPPEDYAHGLDKRSPEDFEEQRLTIVQALAELEVSHPSVADKIQKVARRYDPTGVLYGQFKAMKT